MSEPTAASAPVAAQPAAPVAAPAPAPAAPGNTTVNLHLPPDLLRMANLQAQPAPVAAQPDVSAAQPAAPAAAPAAKTDEKPAEKGDDAIATRLADLEDKYHSTLIRAEIDRVAHIAGAIDHDDVAKLIAGDLDVSADGKVIVKGDPRTAGAQHVARFLASKPHLLKPAVPGGGAGAPSTLTAPQVPAKVDMNDRTSASTYARQRAAARGLLPQ